MSAYEELEQVLRNTDVGYLDRQYFPAEPTAIADKILTKHRAEVIAEFEAYPGELDMLRGVLGVVRTVVRHGHFVETEGVRELRRIIAEHYADERAAYEQAAVKGEKDSAPAPTSTPQPGPSRVQCDHGNYVAHTCPACQIGTRA
ncbi:hypothetical protein [Streptomyces sp.]|uniref:hypothetical protein n=1 Tax=Streptomyces sp. TaxID=1931 RepID=UPI002D787A00|nr:hypothetical protein [Streptomyces sp.]HET6356054.1 hypothetical protein [Streptomyces sp.]